MREMARQDTADLRDYWDGVGADYWQEWESPARARLAQRELEFILAGLRRSAGRRALDVGIGSGRILGHLLANAADTQFYGVDIAPGMVEATRDRLGEQPRMVELAVCDLANDPLPFSERFDFISAIRMLKYNANWREMVAKLAAALEPGGGMVFTMTNRNSLNRVSREDALDWHTATRSDIEQLCRDQGLEILEMTGFTKLPYRAYLRATTERRSRAVLGSDALLDRLMGPATLAREFFVSVRRGT